ncbi:MAG TPA: hypothetical protein VFG53_17655 [Anaeromyxobacter sp.]|nr:hypothetical protein [Anaeromyxobacter sp.]
MKRLFLAALLVALACDKGSPSQKETPTPSATPEGVAPHAAAAALSPTATTWTADCGTVNTTGLYTAPSSGGTCHVTVTSAVSTSVTAVATVTVNQAANVVTVNPATYTLYACTTAQVQATTQSGTLSYAVSEGAAGGSVSATGLYTAPATSGTYHVVATSSAGGSATATMTVQDHVLSVAVSPTSASVSTSGQQQFTATVTTSCGTFPATVN